MRKLVIILPFRLPTWNVILALPLRRRMRLKALIRDAVSECIRDCIDLETSEAGVIRPRLTDLWLLDYYRTMGQKWSPKSSIPKRKSHRTRRRKP